MVLWDNLVEEEVVVDIRQRVGVVVQERAFLEAVVVVVVITSMS
jgi:hypothetical protein